MHFKTRSSAAHIVNFPAACQPTYPNGVFVHDPYKFVYDGPGNCSPHSQGIASLSQWEHQADVKPQKRFQTPVAAGRLFRKATEEERSREVPANVLLVARNPERQIVAVKVAQITNRANRQKVETAVVQLCNCLNPKGRLPNSCLTALDYFTQGDGELYLSALVDITADREFKLPITPLSYHDIFNGSDGLQGESRSHADQWIYLQTGVQFSLQN